MGPMVSSAVRRSARSGVAVSPSRKGARHMRAAMLYEGLGRWWHSSKIDQAEAVAEPLHVQVRRVVGGHRDVEHLVVAAADDADRHAERRREHVVPLAQEVERRHHHQRAALPREDGERGHVGLAGAGGEHHHAAEAVPAPRLQRLALVGEGLVLGHRRERERGVAAGLVHRLDAAGAERQDDTRVVHGGRAVHRLARVPQARRGEAGEGEAGERLAGGEALDPQGPSLEREAHGHGALICRVTWARSSGSGRGARKAAVARCHGVNLAPVHSARGAILGSMSDPIGEQDRSTRAAAVVLGLALAVFFGGMGVSILLAPIHDPGLPRWSWWALRTFIFLIFGAMTGLGVWSVYDGIRGPRAARVLPVPQAILARCPACGEGRPAFCGHAAGELDRAWRETPREGLGGPLLVGAIGGGILSLGVLLAAGAIADGDAWHMRLAYVPLALLLAVVGAAMVFGFALAVREAWRMRGRRDHRLRVTEDGWTVEAEAHLDAGELSLRGDSARSRAIADAAAHLVHHVALPRLAETLARTLAVLHARGTMRLGYVERCSWSLAADGTFTRERMADIDLGSPFPPVLTPLIDAPLDVPSARVIAMTARQLLRALRDDEGLRGELSQIAAGTLADEPDPQVVRALAAVLREGEATAPYR